ncbi:MAG: glycoside hydrolase family 3 N-terminal domain-containing protein [Lachnospiraceae bacterium]|nr:glycoside hydrolase family 3 N-terminal domain-containing protein [Lachnospiraceae bacterium]
MNNIRNIVFAVIIIFIFVYSILGSSNIKTNESGYEVENNEANIKQNESMLGDNQINQDKKASDNDGNGNLNENINSSNNGKDISNTVIDENTTEATNELTEEIKLENKINDILSKMTVEEKVGQMFFVVDDGRFGSEVLKTIPAGGIILFESDFVNKNADDLNKFINEFQNNSKIPLLIGVDEEGGTVVRLSNNSSLVESEFESPRALYEKGGFEAIDNDTKNKSDILLKYGINVNFAPICDYSDVPGSFIYSRSFGTDINQLCEYVDRTITIMKDKKIGSVMKHFPGYGNNGDSHNSVIHDTRYKREFVNQDWKVFRKGIDAGGDCILVCHNIIECLDEENPASLSVEVNKVLREELKFDGVVITDDLKMAGVATLYSEKEVAIKAIMAGNDMLLSTFYEAQYNAVLEAVKAGTIKEEQLDASVRRILRWKNSIGILK